MGGKGQDTVEQYPPGVTQSPSWRSLLAPTLVARSMAGKPVVVPVPVVARASSATSNAMAPTAAATLLTAMSPLFPASFSCGLFGLDWMARAPQASRLVLFYMPVWPFGSKHLYCTPGVSKSCWNGPTLDQIRLYITPNIDFFNIWKGSGKKV